MDDYKTLVKDATRAVVKDGLGGAVWVHRLADANWPDASARTYSFAVHEAIEAINTLGNGDV